MPHFVSPKNDVAQNMTDISSDFACLKVSALGKASRISGEIDRITIGPDSIMKNESVELENIENEQNFCNTKSPMKIMDSQSNKISTQSGITFSVKKILLESELQRKEQVRKEIERHVQHMKENVKAIHEHIAKSRSSMAKERERKSAETLANILAEEERIAEQEEKRRKHEQQLQAQRTQEQKQKLEREMEEYRRSMKEKEELYKRVITLRNEFGMKYCDIVAISKSCKDKNHVAIVLSSYAVRLKELCHQMELIDKKIKTGELVSADIGITEHIVQHIHAILTSFRSETEKLESLSAAHALLNMPAAKEVQTKVDVVKQQPPESIKQVPSEIQIPQQAQAATTNAAHPAVPLNIPHPAPIPVPQPAPTVVPPPAPTTTSPTEEQESDVSQYINKESLQIFINSQTVLENYGKTYNEFLQSASTKKFRFECQKAINIPVNAISGISQDHLRDKYERLHNLLTGRSSPNVTQHPQGAAFCKDTLAKKIVGQGETLVSSKPKMAFPIAAVAVALWNDHPDFGELLLAYIHTTCPFTVPIYMPKIEGLTNEEYYRSLGYKYADDGTVEQHDKFLKRMSGLMRLYVSITITTQRRGVDKPHPYGLQNAWRWIATILNTEPRPMVTDLCATLILDMLEVAGNALWTAYPKQFHKLLILLSQDYFPRMQSAGCIGGGPLVRLEEFLKNSLSKRSIPPCEGQFPPNFW